MSFPPGGEGRDLHRSANGERSFLGLPPTASRKGFRLNRAAKQDATCEQESPLREQRHKGSQPPCIHSRTPSFCILPSPVRFFFSFAALTKTTEEPVYTAFADAPLKVEEQRTGAPAALFRNASTRPKLAGRGEQHEGPLYQRSVPEKTLTQRREILK